MALSQARVLGPGGREGSQTQGAAAALTRRGCGRGWVSQAGSLVSAGRRGKGFSESACLGGYDNNNRWLLCVPGVPGWSLGYPQGTIFDRHRQPTRVLPLLLHLIDTEMLRDPRNTAVDAIQLRPLTPGC